MVTALKQKLKKRNVATPYIIQAGPANAILVAENCIYVEVDELLQALAAVIGLYYVYIQNNGAIVCCSSKISYSGLHLVQLSVLYQQG